MGVDEQSSILTPIHYTMMMHKPTLSSLLTFLLSVVLLFSVPVQADGCIGPICGKIHNKSSWTLLYTTDPRRPGKPCTSCCYFWNWDSDGEMTTCTQTPLASKGSAGGSSVDVDGFCYADRDYWYNGRKIVKGQWTKFNTLQTITCKDKAGAPHCYS